MPITDEEAALQAISTLETLAPSQKQAQAEINSILSPLNQDPHIDIHQLFHLYNILYFRNLLLPRVEVCWSARLTLCAGICELIKDTSGRYTRIRLKLSEPLLKFRPRADTINTLLHECIHAYFFVTSSWRHSRGDDGTGHGVGFLLLADAISNHGYGEGDQRGEYQITVYHTFHDEVDSYRTHVWQCDGPCKGEAPYFGMVKRSMNRAPGKGDAWWKRHGEECGGSFVKVAQPELTKEQVGRLTGMQRAGRQKNKLDAWVRGMAGSDEEERSVREGDVEEGTQEARERCSASGQKRSWSMRNGGGHEAEEGGADEGSGSGKRTFAACPICNVPMVIELVNHHIDMNHPP